MSARSLLQLYADRPDRAGEDRLEILTALTGGPSFDPVYGPDVIKIPRGHAIYRWECVVGRCERTRSGGTDLCAAHLQEWTRAREAGGAGKAAFVSAAEGLDRHERAEQAACQVCPRPGGSHPAAALPAAHQPVPRQQGRRRRRGRFRALACRAGPLRGIRHLPGHGLPGPGRLAAWPVLRARDPLQDRGPARQGIAAPVLVTLFRTARAAGSPRRRRRAAVR